LGRKFRAVVLSLIRGVSLALLGIIPRIATPRREEQEDRRQEGDREREKERGEGEAGGDTAIVRK